MILCLAKSNADRKARSLKDSFSYSGFQITYGI